MFGFSPVCDLTCLCSSEGRSKNLKHVEQMRMLRQFLIFCHFSSVKCWIACGYLRKTFNLSSKRDEPSRWDDLMIFLLASALFTDRSKGCEFSSIVRALSSEWNRLKLSVESSRGFIASKRNGLKWTRWTMKAFNGKLKQNVPVFRCDESSRQVVHSSQWRARNLWQRTAERRGTRWYREQWQKHVNIRRGWGSSVEN